MDIKLEIDALQMDKDGPGCDANRTKLVITQFNNSVDFVSADNPKLTSINKTDLIKILEFLING